jgi:aspartate kinase
VQKYGGSSVATPAKILSCAQRVAAAARDGGRVAVVVSAMGDTTDDLLALAEAVGGVHNKREVDQLLATGEQVSIALLAMALRSMDVPAVSLTGQQAGIATELQHGRARITDIRPGRVEAELEAGRVPVIAGFQGMAPTGDVTTLGRGGSDTTAVAVAAALAADECEIYTDVDGIYTADPRVVPEARLLSRISYEEMLEAASQGARVMHLRSVELGMKAGVPIRVLHAQRAGTVPGVNGTLICDLQTANHAMEHRKAVTTVALKTDIGRVSLEDLPNRPGVQSEVFKRVAKAGISVDDIIQHEVETGPSAGKLCNLVFTVEKTDLPEITPIVDAVIAALGSGRSRVDLGLAKVSAVGAGMQSQPGVASQMFTALAEAGIVIANITTSEIKVSCIVPEADGPRALRAVHEAFGLGG